MQRSEEGKHFDVAVVGAGLSGIVTAARYLQANPDSHLTILEQDYCVGGVWSERRIYPSFWSQWAYGTAEFADMAMTRPPPEDCAYDLFRAKYTTNYLEDYVDNIKISGRTLRDRIQFKVAVQSILKTGNYWCLTCTASDKPGPDKIFTASKLIIANGQSSVPRLPELVGKEDFAGAILHSVDFGQSNVLSNNNFQHVAVLGGGKSAADMVYEAVKAGKTVSWIIRPTGPDSTGPGFFAPADTPTPYQNPGFAAHTRVMASLQPSLWNKETWWTRFLHRTNVGVHLVGWIFSQADALIQKRAGYKERRSSKGFEKLQYETGIFWQNGTGGVLHHDDFFSLVADKVNIYRARVKMLLRKEIYLDDEAGTHFPCDAILCGTGWKRGLNMFSTELSMSLGLPYPKSLEPPESAAKWEALVKEADETVLRKFPILRHPPAHPHVYQDKTPYRLYKGMAPLNDDSIIFINHVTFSNKLFGAEAQAMWAVAYFGRHVHLPSIAEREQEVSTWIAWCRRRYLSNGELGNCVVYDGVPYADALLDDMGVTAHRQKGWLRNFFAPFFPTDFGKAWTEYLHSHSG